MSNVIEGIDIVVNPNVPEYTIFAIGSLDLVEAIAAMNDEQRLALARKLVPDAVIIADPRAFMRLVNEDYLSGNYDKIVDLLGLTGVEWR